MVILIDAYNVLKRFGQQLISEAQQTGFISSMAAYARAKSHTIIIVFDGGSQRHPLREHHGRVEVVYSGYGATADEVIKQYLPTVYPENTVLVTSDRALRDYAGAYGILSLEPSLFIYYSKTEPETLRRVVRDPRKPRKLEGHESSSDLDALMEEASNVIFYKDTKSKDRDINERGRKLSKEERKLARIVQKL